MENKKIYFINMGGTFKKIYCFLSYEDAFNFMRKAGRWSDLEISVWIQSASFDEFNKAEINVGILR